MLDWNWSDWPRRAALARRMHSTRPRVNAVWMLLAWLIRGGRRAAVSGRHSSCSRSSIGILRVRVAYSALWPKKKKKKNSLISDSWYRISGYHKDIKVHVLQTLYTGTCTNPIRHTGYIFIAKSLRMYEGTCILSVLWSFVIIMLD